MTIPAGLIILVKDRAYMTVRDFPGPGGDGTSTGGGIAPMSDNFGKGEAFKRWISAVEAEFANTMGGGLTLESIDRSYILTGGEVPRAEAPMQPAVTAFRTEAGSEFFLARWMTLCGRVEPKEAEVSAWIVPEGHDLLARHAGIMDKFRDLQQFDTPSDPGYRDAQASWIDALLTAEDILAANLARVYASVTLARAAEEDLGLGRSDSAGDGFA